MRTGTVAGVVSVVLLALAVRPSLALALSSPEEERQARAQDVRKTLEAINKELEANGGTFEKWGEKLKAFREDVKQTSARPARPIKENYRISSQERDMLLLDTMDRMPPDQQVFKAVLHLDRQLKTRGVDLIFLPIPDKSAVYPEVLSDNVPADGIVAIHVKHLMKQLLENDVEVVDMYPVYRDFRIQTNRKVPLYYESQDIHWRNKAAQLVGEVVGERLKRYAFVQQALAAGNPFKSELFARTGTKADQVLAIVNTKTGAHYQDVADSPVVITADSYGTYCFLLKDEQDKIHDGHLPGQVALNIAMPLTYLHKEGLWGDMPVLLAKEEQQNGYLKGRRVIVFTCIGRSFKLSRWPLVDLPAAPGAGATAPPKPDASVAASGAIVEVSPGPAADRPYPFYFMLAYVKDLKDAAGKPVGTGDGVVHVLAMHQRKTLPAAKVKAGDKIELRLRPWSAVEKDYGKIQTGQLPTAQLDQEKTHYLGEVQGAPVLTPADAGAAVQR